MIGAVNSCKRLTRTTFTTSRLMEFCSIKELTLQTGHDPNLWPLVVLKELLDNSLDASEEAGSAPDIQITVEGDTITVTDNGPGFPAETLKGVLDFSVRVSSREAYVAVDRGQQGNALKTVLAMPFVLHGEEGRVVIEAHGEAHEVTFRVNQIQQAPVVDCTSSSSIVKNGTRVTVHWPHSACSYLTDARDRFLQMAESYCWLNPHLTLVVRWENAGFDIAAVEPAWSKWRPSDPTSPHWYTPERLERLVTAYVKHDEDHGRDRTIREFVSEFRGLTGSAKQTQVLKATGTARALIKGLCPDDRINRPAIAGLLTAMQAHSKPVKPPALGIIGKEHFARRCAAAGGHPDSFDYRKAVGVTDGLPWLLETAFAWAPNLETRRIITGVNWSPGILNPFRQLGRLGESLDTVLTRQRASLGEPVIFVLHLACPRVAFTDRGKSAVALPESQ